MLFTRSEYKMLALVLLLTITGFAMKVYRSREPQLLDSSEKIISNSMLRSIGTNGKNDELGKKLEILPSDNEAKGLAKRTDAEFHQADKEIRSESNAVYPFAPDKNHPATENKKAAKFSKPLSINKATASEFCQIKGIGPKTAELIVAYRSKNGAFSSLEDLKKVKGIGEKKFEKFKQYLSL